MRAHLGLAAVALRPGEVELSDGSTLYGDAIVVATGLVARRLPDQPAHVHTLRTLDDALALRATLERAGSLLIVGAGFIGAEVATAARARGHRGDRAGGAAGAVRSGRSGRRWARWPARLLTEAGVDLRVDTAPTGFVEDSATGWRCGCPTAAVLTADAGLVGIGGVPGWTGCAGAQPPAHDPAAGLRCDPSGRVHGRERCGRSATWRCGTTRWTGRRTATSTGPAPATRPRWWPGTSWRRPAAACRALLLVRPVRAQDPAARPARVRRRGAAAARRGWTAARCAARWPATWPATGWWPWSASAPPARGRATAPLVADAHPRDPTCWPAPPSSAPDPPGQRNILRSTARATSTPTAIRRVADPRVVAAGPARSAGRRRPAASGWPARSARPGSRRARSWPSRSRAGWCPGRAPR